MSGDFQVIERRAGPPHRPRGLLTGYAVFQGHRHAVFVHPGVCARIGAAARGAQPHEAGGLLAGRVLQDADGGYTLVEGAVVAPPQAGSVGRIMMSPELTAGLRTQAATRYPACDVVGWWHSHVGVSGYSEVDRANQRAWSDPGHVGLLVFARAASPRAMAYLGPQSLALQTLADGPFDAAEWPGQDATGDGEGAGTGGVRGGRAGAAKWGIRPDDPISVAVQTALRLHDMDRGWRRLLLVLAGGTVLALVACLVGIAAVTAAVHRMSDPQRPAVAWSCAPQTEGGFLCQVFSPLAGELEWWLDGEPRGSAAYSLAVIVPVGGRSSVELRRPSPGGRSDRVGSVLLRTAVAQGSGPVQSDPARGDPAQGSPAPGAGQGTSAGTCRTAVGGGGC
jgi:proteasome lid subunit RPN8/RPN11